jgi:hypothetical protein
MTFFLQRVDDDNDSDAHNKLIRLAFDDCVQQIAIGLNGDEPFVAVDDTKSAQLALRPSGTILVAKVIGLACALGPHGTEVALRDGDEFQVGQQRFRVVSRPGKKVRLCPMGDKCERMNPLHRQSYSHAAAATAVGAAAAAGAAAVTAATAAAPTSVPVAAAVELPVAIPVAQRKSTVTAAPGWRGDLQRIALHAEKSDVVLFFNEHVAVIPDKFPKSSVHLLVIARDISLNKPSELTRDHLPLLLEMQRVAQLQVKQRMPGRRVQIGVHVVPSMMAFHVHVMTCDFVSDSLKNKKHWNSFTTAFFVPLETLIRVLERDGAFRVDEHASEELLRGEMACPRCGAVLPTIPAVKKHMPCE